jgi:RimJ/RimL family protein N-acetyltransferase
MALADIECVEGHNLRLRLITTSDAEYVYGLRIDPAYNTHLSQVSGTAEDQRRWIEGYKAREAQRQELYYIIERKDGVPCGTVRLYEIGEHSFTWGSWILDHNKPRKAALESAVLSFGIGFGPLGMEVAHFDARRGNQKAISFYERFGAERIRQDAQDVFFKYDRSRFVSDRAGYMAMLQEEKQA